jgi:hypothetical protein
VNIVRKASWEELEIKHNECAEIYNTKDKATESVMDVSLLSVHRPQGNRIETPIKGLHCTHLTCHGLDDWREGFQRCIPFQCDENNPNKLKVRLSTHYRTAHIAAQHTAHTAHTAHTPVLLLPQLPLAPWKCLVPGCDVEVNGLTTDPIMQHIINTCPEGMDVVEIRREVNCFVIMCVMCVVCVLCCMPHARVFNVCAGKWAFGMAPKNRPISS